MHYSNVLFYIIFSNHDLKARWLLLTFWNETPYHISTRSLLSVSTEPAGQGRHCVVCCQVTDTKLSVRELVISEQREHEPKVIGSTGA